MTVRSESSVLYTRLPLPRLDADVRITLKRAGCPLIYHALLYTPCHYTVRSPCSVARTGYPSRHTRYALPPPASCAYAPWHACRLLRSLHQCTQNGHSSQSPTGLSSHCRVTTDPDLTPHLTVIHSLELRLHHATRHTPLSISRLVFGRLLLRQTQQSILREGQIVEMLPHLYSVPNFRVATAKYALNPRATSNVVRIPLQKCSQ